MFLSDGQSVSQKLGIVGWHTTACSVFWMMERVMRSLGTLSIPQNISSSSGLINFCQRDFSICTDCPMVFMRCCKETSRLTSQCPCRAAPCLCYAQSLVHVKQRTYIWYNYYLGSIITIVSSQLQTRKDNGVAKAAHTLFKLLPIL